MQPTAARPDTIRTMSVLLLLLPPLLLLLLLLAVASSGRPGRAGGRQGRV